MIIIIKVFYKFTQDARKEKRKGSKIVRFHGMRH